MKGYIQNVYTGEWFKADGLGTTLDKAQAFEYDRKDVQLILDVHASSLRFIPIETKQKEKTTMNYIEAVKILVNNPKAMAITFLTSTGTKRRIELRLKSFRGESYQYLVFPETPEKRQQTVIAHSPDFLLREDFSIEYKKEDIYTRVSNVTAVPREDVKKVLHTINYMAQDESAREFFRNMAKLFGEEK